MGLRPTRANGNQRRHPRAGGGPCQEELDSRLRGNDMRAVTFRRAAGGPERSRGGMSHSSENACAEGTLECGGSTPPWNFGTAPARLRTAFAARCATAASSRRTPRRCAHFHGLWVPP